MLERARSILLGTARSARAVGILAVVAAFFLVAAFAQETPGGKLLNFGLTVGFALLVVSVAVAGAAALLTPVFARNPSRERQLQYLGTAAIVLLAILLPAYIESIPGNKITLLTVSTAITFMMAIVGLNLLMGYGGQISLGHAAFFGIGGYTTAIFIKEWGWDWWWTLPFAAFFSGVAGFLFGFPALRFKGLYLALATLALALVVTPILKHKDLEEWTGGVQGIGIFLLVKPPFGWPADKFFYYSCAAVAGLVFFLAWNLVRGRFGRALIAIRDSETAAAAMGVNIALYKTTAFGISAAFAGLGGALNAVLIGFVSPDQYNVTLSIRLLTATVVGGLGSIVGGLFGGLFEQFVPTYMSEISKAAPDAIFAVLLIVLMYVMPTGLSGFIHRLWHFGQRRTARGSPIAQGSSSTGLPPSTPTVAAAHEPSQEEL